MSKTFFASLIMVLLVLVPACRTTKKNVKTDTQPPAVMDTTPTVPPPPPPTETAVEQKDFVQETPAEEVIPTDETELNNWARGKGYIRDAFYNYDEATLDDAAQQALTASATWLRSSQGTGYKLLIEGHCDERGTEQYNLALGDRRANSAKDYLVTLGVDASRIRTVSYGEERPFEEGHDDAAWSQNRGSHLVLVR
ncbi:MAG: OmpA family protein [Thermoanaerobaculia bacterium]